MKTLKEWAEAHGVTFVGRSAGVYTTGTVSEAALEEIFAEADAMRRDRDELARQNAELAARLAEIEQAEPVAWIERITGRLAAPTDEHRTRFPMVYRPLIARPAPAQRVSAADEFPADGCGACGDACRLRGSCRLADESPKPAARPCRCGPDGCPDRVSCPRGEQ